MADRRSSAENLYFPSSYPTPPPPTPVAYFKNEGLGSSRNFREWKSSDCPDNAGAFSPQAVRKYFDSDDTYASFSCSNQRSPNSSINSDLISGKPGPTFNFKTGNPNSGHQSANANAGSNPQQGSKNKSSSNFKKNPSNKDKSEYFQLRDTLMRHAKGKDWAKALHGLRTMRNSGYVPPTLLYNTVIHACGSERRWQLALQLLEEVKETEGIEPDIITYNAAMSACVKARQWQLAIRLFDEIQTNTELVPTIITYNTILSACEKGCQADLALHILSTMQKLSHIDVDAMTFSAVISACGKAGYWEKSLELLREMEVVFGVNPDSICYTCAISAVERAKHPKLVLSLFEEMMSKGLPDNQVIQHSVRNSRALIQQF